MTQKSYDAVLKEAVVEVVSPDTIVSAAPAVIHTLDLESCTLADTEFYSDFKLVAERDAEITSLAGYFDCLFDLENKVRRASFAFS